MSKLTNTDKYTIQGMLADNKSAKQMSKALSKPIADVQSYLEKLDKTLNTITKNKIESEDKIQTFSRTEDEDKIISDVKKRLMSAGLTERDSDGVLTTALAVMDKQNDVVDDVDKLYTMCISRLNTSTMMVKKSAGGREGVMIMNSAVSAKMDDKPKQNNMPRRTDGSLWNIKEKTIINSNKGKK